MQNKLIWKILAISIVLVIVASSIAVSANTMYKASNGSDSKVSFASTTIYVPYNYATIQAAVNAAYPGDTIMVKDGTYIENIKVYKRLTVRSENGSASTIVRAEDPDDHVFEVTADYVNIRGFTVEGEIGWDYAGIYLYYADYCNISNNNCSNNDYGSYLGYSNNNSISNNNCCLNNEGGISLKHSKNNSISNNSCSNNSWTGIYLWSDNNIVYLNNFINNAVNAFSFGLTNTWNSKEKITYVYNGTTYESYLGNYWHDYEEKYPDAEEIDSAGIWNMP